MSSNEAYFLTLEQARIPVPRIDTTPNQMELFMQTNPVLFPEWKEPERDDC